MERASREDAVVYWGDETGVSNCETVERGFAPKGRPPVLPVETKRERVNMLSAISREGHVRFMVYQDAMNQGRLIQFMQRLIRTSERKVFLVLDNLKVHHGKLVKAWLEKKKAQIEVFFLPPYAPDYNPDEYLNHALCILGIFLIRRRISLITFIHLCVGSSIIPLGLFVFSSIRFFPIFRRRSNK